MACILNLQNNLSMQRYIIRLINQILKVIWQRLQAERHQLQQVREEALEVRYHKNRRIRVKCILLKPVVQKLRYLIRPRTLRRDFLRDRIKIKVHNRIEIHKLFLLQGWEGAHWRIRTDPRRKVIFKTNLIIHHSIIKATNN